MLTNFFLGVIIDTFANLTDELKSKTKDKEHICFICGTNSEKLDKVSERGGYHSHIKVKTQKILIFLTI